MPRRKTSFRPPIARLDKDSLVLRHHFPNNDRAASQGNSQIPAVRRVKRKILYYAVTVECRCRLAIMACCPEISPFEPTWIATALVHGAAGEHLFGAF
jgi:hypothetical protein